MKRCLALLLLALSAVVSAQQADQELFREAENRFLAGEYELALDRYRTLVSDYPLSQFVPDAQFRIGVSLFQAGFAEDALSQLDRVTRRFRSTRYLGLVPFWRGVMEFELGRYAAAVASLERFLEDPAVAEELQADARVYLARGYEALGDRLRATATLASLFDSGRSAAEYPFAFVLLLSLHARAGEAEQLLSRAQAVDLSSFPSRWRDHLRLYEAEAQFQLGSIERALPGFRAAETGEPRLATLALQRQFSLAQQGLIDEEPESVVRRAEQLLSGNAEVLSDFWLRVGIDSYDAGRLDRAELYFTRIWSLRESRLIAPESVLYLARLYEDTGETVRGREVLEEYLQRYGEREPLRTRILLLLGNLQLQTGASAQAVTTLEQAYARVFAAQPPDSQLAAEVAYQYAYALRRAGDPGESLAVIGDLEAAGIASTSLPPLLRLRARALRESGRLNEAIEVLSAYRSIRPDDGQALLELVNLLFSTDQFMRVVSILGDLSDRSPDSTFDELVEAQLSYVEGLALVNLSRYTDAAQAFASVTAVSATVSDALGNILPWAYYYRGWALYRAGSYHEAVPPFSMLVDRFPEHPQAAQAAYLAGWSEFQQARYPSAREYLARVELLPASATLMVEARFLRARALASQGASREASAEFLALYQNNPQSQLADDALFEYAEAELAGGNAAGAAAGFAELVERYPQSDLAVVAAFRRAEVLFEAGRFTQAREAYRAYRAAYPKGAQIDAALFWGAEASLRAAEDAGALLLWSRLIDEFRQSPFRPDAMQRAAELHRQRDEYRQSLALYRDLQASYPQYARAADAQRIIDQLVLQIDGLAEREAQLLVTITSEGVLSSAGRQAALELGRLVLGRPAASVTVNRVLGYLEEVAAGAADPVRAGQAEFLIAEHLRSLEQYSQAAERYLTAATVGSADSDLAAVSIYRAAESLATIGQRSEATELVEELEDRFPDSEWTEEARLLLEGGQR